LKPEIKLRGNGHWTTLRGDRSEMVVAQYFRNRKLEVLEQGHERLNHDLLVERFGRVQVKTCHMIDRKESGRKGWLPTSKRLRCNLCASDRRYATGVIDWFAFVYYQNDSPRVWLVPESKLRANGEYLISGYSIALNSVRARWESVDLTPTLLEAV
jgi:hypothetical protein